MTTPVCTVVTQQLGELFCCREQGVFTRVRTPFLFPDGGIVDVFCRGSDGGWTVTDLSEALGWLRLQSISGKRSPKQNKLVQDICLTMGVELFRGQLVARCADSANLGATVVRVGQAVVRVADLWFTMRVRSVESATEEVTDFLTDRAIPFERSVKLGGRSGRDWTVDFQTRTPAQSALVFVLASGSRPAARRVAEHVVAGWHDLQQFKIGPSALRFVSLFDDTVDIWSEEDFKLVESISEVSRWSRPDEFEKLIIAA
jgi:hypothetical protein